MTTGRTVVHELDISMASTLGVAHAEESPVEGPPTIFTVESLLTCYLTWSRKPSNSNFLCIVDVGFSSRERGLSTLLRTLQSPNNLDPKPQIPDPIWSLNPKP